MHNILALTKRILRQFWHDKRTLALFIIAPIVALWLFSTILGVSSYKPNMAAVELPEDIVAAMQKQAVNVSVETFENAEEMLEHEQIDAFVFLQNDTLTVKVEGSDASKTAATMAVVQATFKQYLSEQKTQFAENMQKNKSKMAMAKMMGVEMPQMPININEIKPEYLHGNEKWTVFDFFGPVFIGIFIFIFVFITSGMSLVTERTGGTMERLLATPIKSWQLVGGYSLGFGCVSIIQSCLVLSACIWLIDFPNEGNIALVILVTLSMALVSLTLGLLVSALAKTAFQVIQFMVLLVVPQILLSNIFDLSQAPKWLQALSLCFPVRHGAEALRNVMLKGVNFFEISVNLLILWGFITVFFVLATISFNFRRR